MILAVWTRGWKSWIAAKEAGIDIPELDFLAFIERYYASGSDGAAATGAMATKLFAMYDRHSRALREHPELIAVIAGLSDPIGETIERSAASPDSVSREAVAEAVGCGAGEGNDARSDGLDIADRCGRVEPVMVGA